MATKTYNTFFDNYNSDFKNESLLIKNLYYYLSSISDDYKKGSQLLTRHDIEKYFNDFVNNQQKTNFQKLYESSSIINNYNDLVNSYLLIFKNKFATLEVEVNKNE